MIIRHVQREKRETTPANLCFCAVRRGCRLIGCGTSGAAALPGAQRYREVWQSKTMSNHLGLSRSASAGSAGSSGRSGYYAATLRQPQGEPIWWPEHSSIKRESAPKDAPGVFVLYAPPRLSTDNDDNSGIRCRLCQLSRCRDHGILIAYCDAGSSAAAECGPNTSLGSRRS